jgi:serine/threonine protein kinase
MILWLLTYDPDLRPSAATALKHPFFNEMHFAKIPNQKRSNVMSKAISGAPLLPDKEQGGVRRNLENTKEESKGENAYSLERSKVNKERASSKLLRSIQKNCRRVSRRLAKRKLLPSTINLPKITTISRSKRQTLFDRANNSNLGKVSA